jgi:hypothetical protein
LKRSLKEKFIMVKFLITGSYTPDGAKALAQEGGSKRKAAVEKMVASIGGRLEAALTLAVNSSGMVKISSVMLLTPEEIDAACKKTVSYRAPGR